MGWYVVNAVGKAIERTRTCLFEPFDLWKWMKLVIIVMLIGGGSSFNGGGGGNSLDDITLQDPGATDSFTEALGESIDKLQTGPGLELIIGIILLILILILFFSYISSVMEFVFVDSLVSNDVRFWEYFRRYLGKGLGLFVFRLLVFVVLLSLIALMALSFVIPLIGSSWDTFPDAIMSNIVSFILLLIGIILIAAIIGGIIGSFINLSIPVAIYTETGIFRAFANVFGQFRKNWQQFLVYWIGRFFLGLAVGIAVGIILLITIILAGFFILLADLLIYFTISALLSGSDTLVWIVLVPMIVIQAILFIVSLAVIAMPARVFLKYHMLTFLQQWYPDTEIPMFDMQQINENVGSVTET